MCTELKGKASWFLPFNKGHDDGAGNPPNPHGLKTDYLWKESLTPAGLTDILENYAQIVEIKLGVAPGDVIAVQGAFSLSQLRGVSPGAASEPAKTPDTAPAKQEPKPSSDGADHTHG